MTTRTERVLEIAKQIIEHEQAIRRLRGELAGLVPEGAATAPPRPHTVVVGDDHGIPSAEAFGVPKVVGRRMGSVKGSVPYMILETMRREPGKAFTAPMLAEALKGEKKVKDIGSIYSNLARLKKDGQIEKAGTGAYRIATAAATEH